MEKYMTMIASASLVMSCVILGLILFNKLFAGKYSAKWRYYIWIIVLLGLLIPFRPDISLPFEPVQVPVAFDKFDKLDEFNNSAGRNQEYVLSSADSSPDIFTKTELTAAEILKIENITAVWIIGVILSLAFYLLHHRRFTKMIKRWGTDISDCKMLSAFAEVQTGLGISRQVKLKKCKLITSPMLAGFIKPVILLPDRVIHEDDLLIILKHELIHYKRKDLWINLLLVMTTAVHWFNPVVHIMAGAVRNDCETSCDEAVLGNTGAENRRMYGEAIIGFAGTTGTIGTTGTEKAVKTALSTNFYGGKNTMKKRITAIMNKNKKKTGIAVLCGVLVLALTFASGFVFALTPSADITAEKAWETALAKTGGGTVVKCELDYIGNAETGIRIYEIEVINGNTKYELEIGVNDSVIYGFEESTSSTTKDRSANLPADTDITADEAIKIALAKTGAGEPTKWELNGKDSSKVYKIEIISGEIKYTMNVGASDGKITNYKEKAVNPDKINKVTESVQPALISAEEAKAIALERAGGGIAEECELDLEKGLWVYEIEIKDGKTEYESDINAETGEIIKFETDD